MVPGNPDPADGVHTWTFVVLESPIEPDDLPDGTQDVVDHYNEETRVFFCLVEKMETPGEEPDYVVSFDVPQNFGDGSFRVRTFETHHYEAWLDLRPTEETLVGSFNSLGFGGPTEIPVSARRIGPASPIPCLDAIRALIDS